MSCLLEIVIRAYSFLIALNSHCALPLCDPLKFILVGYRMLLLIEEANDSLWGPVHLFLNVPQPENGCNIFLNG